MRPVSRYAPPVAVMALIFALSATPDLSSGLGRWDLPLRKIAHVTIYGVLWLTLTRATLWRRPFAATAVALLYAATDELHQTFVDGRHGTPVDVAIDAIGMGVAAVAWTLAARRRGGRPGPPGRCAPRARKPEAAPARKPEAVPRARRGRSYSQPRSVAMSTACARSTAPSLP